MQTNLSLRVHVRKAAATAIAAVAAAVTLVPVGQAAVEPDASGTYVPFVTDFPKPAAEKPYVPFVTDFPNPAGETYVPAATASTSRVDWRDAVIASGAGAALAALLAASWLALGRRATPARS